MMRQALGNRRQLTDGRSDLSAQLRGQAATAAGLALGVALAWLLAHGHYRLPLLLGILAWYLLGDLRRVFVSSILLIGLSPLIMLGPGDGWRPDEYLLLVLLGRWLLAVSRHSQQRHPFRLGAPVAVYVLALWIAAAAAGPGNMSRTDALRYLFTLTKPLQWVLWLFLAEQFLHEPRVRRWTMGALAFTLLAVCLIGLVQYLDLGGMRATIANLYPSRSAAMASLSEVLGARRATSTFGQPNWFASFIAASLPLAFVLGGMLRPAMRQALILTMVPAVFLALCYSGSRGGMLATATGLLVLGALRLGRARSFVGLTLVAALIVTAIVLAPSFAAPQQRAYSMLIAKRYPTSPGFVQNMLADPRLPAWRYFAAVFARRPVFGDGMAEAVDNQYLFILVRYGFAGFLPFLFLLFALVRTGWRAWRRSYAGPDESVAAAALAGMLAVLVNGITDSPLQTHRTMEIFWLLAAFATVLAHPRQTPSEEPEAEADLQSYPSNRFRRDLRLSGSAIPAANPTMSGFHERDADG
jgi:O-antigen ligase